MPICATALKLDPTNTKLQSAVEKSQAQVAGLGDAKDAAMGSASAKADGAVDDAAAAAKDAMPKGMPGN